MRLIDKSTATRKSKDSASATRKLRDIYPMNDYTVTLVPNVVVVTAGVTTMATVDDANLTTVTAAVTNNTQDLQVSAPLGGPFGFPTVTFTNNSPGVVSIDSLGNTTYVANGTAEIVVNAYPYDSKAVEFGSLQMGGQSVTTLSSFVTGSLGLDLVTSMATMLGVLSPSPTTYDLYSAADDTNGIYTRNPNLFAASVDLSCIPVWNSYFAPSNQYNKYGGVLISPRHLLMVAHAHPASGTIRFVDNSNTTVTRTIVDQLVVPGLDLMVTLLDSDVPGGISFAQILPDNFRDYLPQPPLGYPSLNTNQFRTLRVGDLTATPSGSVTVTQSIDPTRAPWFSPIIVGDSGSPLLMIIGGQPVVLAQLAQGGPTLCGGPSDADNRMAIESVMATLLPSPLYTLSQIDLSAYNSY
jgi:hypothetical protein